MLFYINIGLFILIILNFRVSMYYVCKLYIIGEQYITELIYRNRNTTTYYTTTTFTQHNSYQEIEPSMLVKLEYKDKIKFIISNHEIKKAAVEHIMVCPNLFSSVELYYRDTNINNKVDLTTETNMILTNNAEIEFNNKLANVLLFIKTNSYRRPINSKIEWGIITSKAEIYKTDYIKFIVEDNKLLEYKE
jgi:hypothetical protein